MAFPPRRRADLPKTVAVPSGVAAAQWHNWRATRPITNRRGLCVAQIRAFHHPHPSSLCNTLHHPEHNGIFVIVELIGVSCRYLSCSLNIDSVRVASSLQCFTSRECFVQRTLPSIIRPVLQSTTARRGIVDPPKRELSCLRALSS